MTRRSAAAADRPPVDAGRHPDEGDTRERILDVALDLFIEQGYDKTTLRQIAEPLGFTQAAIYYHFAAKEDILVALHLRLHELGRPVLEQLAAQAGPSGWAAVLSDLVDTLLANRKLFILHQRNQTALSGLHIKGHDGDHEDMGQQFRQILGNPAVPARDRVRLSCALGALLSILMSVGELEDLGPAVYGELFREAITDLLEPRDTPAAGRALPVKRTTPVTTHATPGRVPGSLSAQTRSPQAKNPQVSAANRPRTQDREPSRVTHRKHGRGVQCPSSTSERRRP
jgi:AcrR family transcriptional regulator